MRVPDAADGAASAAGDERLPLWPLLVPLALLVLVPLTPFLPIDAALESLRQGIVSAGVFGLLISIAIGALWMVVLPALPVQFFLAAVFGFAVGLGGSLIAAFVGMLLSFSLGRRWGRPSVVPLLRRYPRLAAVDGVLERQPWTCAIMLRLAPIAPAPVVSWVLGCSAMAWSPAVWGTMLGKLPGMVIAAAVGAAAFGPDGEASRWPLIATALAGSLVAVGLAVIAWRRVNARQEAGQRPN